MGFAANPTALTSVSIFFFNKEAEDRTYEATTSGILLKSLTTRQNLMVFLV
jgi:hypothetical protein